MKMQMVETQLPTDRDVIINGEHTVTSPTQIIPPIMHMRLMGYFAGVFGIVNDAPEIDPTTIPSSTDTGKLSRKHNASPT
jgi:hypothetical protein